MVSQFLSSHKVNLLNSINYPFPEGTHAIGRLDSNSEGLLLLSTDKRVTRLLFNPEKKHARVYLVQVKNKMSEEDLIMLKTGVNIRIKGNKNYLTPPCETEIMCAPP